ncbi:hypothetical protein I4U23_013613 [Adineta vaga]|nr:hypothetical protein I4U23_013613 [Adineta vaga]
MLSRYKFEKKPPFYDVCNDTFYHGPAWVIKPRLFPPKESQVKKPGPGYYHIPDRSVYTRPGVTIGSRYETLPPVSTQLLAHYYPNDRCISSAQVPTISITPRRTKHEHSRGYYGRFYSPSNLFDHRGAPLLRPLNRLDPSRNSLDKNSSSISPGPATYPMYEYDEDILPRPQPGFTQKHRLSSTRNGAILQINPPFYYPNKADQHRLPSFSFGKRLLASEKIHQRTAPYYAPYDGQLTCSSRMKAGITLKGRWSPAICILTEQ